ncbi:two-component sensor histidine kinase [Pseudorhizobium tarimense]|uniref:histidine kinase n=1 Tax=Pseudorhizobium tarimense TaxID=1079109 RepID=A0ABV2HA39_9HYPH|nr:hypothetical protein [Pseudorhizobium tarimense]MCJ8520587.1 hypothetical protein [Pseudorhizobium tarimense]
MQATVFAALEPLGVLNGGRVDANGQKVVLNSSALMAINLILHEVGTNAVKYGALSKERGRITIQWALLADEGSDMLHLDWREEGGP